jgi:hypothetical protein
MNFGTKQATVIDETETTPKEVFDFCSNALSLVYNFSDGNLYRRSDPRLEQ